MTALLVTLGVLAIVAIRRGQVPHTRVLPSRLANALRGSVRTMPRSERLALPPVRR